MPRGQARKTNIHSWRTIGPQIDKLNETNKELTALLPLLLKVATGETPHIYSGLCPDTMEGYTTRDPECEACQILCKADKIAAISTKDI